MPVVRMEGLAGALLEGSLDDFTHADLARTDLTGRDLAGIRWSTGVPHGHREPTPTNCARSQETAPGIYEITRPSHDDKARHHTSA